MAVSQGNRTVSTTPTVFTVGHSNHTLELFIGLLKEAGVTAVADVRSVPYSRFAPQFNREILTDALRAAGISYSFLGAELGARPSDPNCYRNGVADYGLISATPLFQSGLDRVIEGGRRYRIALMCAEKDPLDCHRTILVGRNLAKRGAVIRHIHADGQIEDSAQAEKRLIKLTKQEIDDLFPLPGTPSDPLDRAYAIREKMISHAEDNQKLPNTDKQLATGM